MGNLGAREKYGLILLAVVLIVFGIYMLGIRPAEDRFVELDSQRQELINTKAYYDSLRQQNADTQAQIEELDSQITEIENSFIPEIKTEVIENYLADTFISNGSPYLVSMNSEDVTAPTIVLPDGTVAEDNMLIKRINVSYATSDGFNIGQYNRDTSVIENGIPNVDELAELLAGLQWKGAESRVEYDNFVSALKEIEAVNPDCILLNNIDISSESGYLVMNATIDFYSADFANRVSSPALNGPYVQWNGATNVATNAGFIGMPFIVEDPNSEWFNVMMTDADATSGSRPFATYYSNAIFRQLVDSTGLAATLGLEDAQNTPEPETQAEE